jgi:hypothetical protein
VCSVFHLSTLFIKKGREEEEEEEEDEHERKTENPSSVSRVPLV